MNKKTKAAALLSVVLFCGVSTAEEISYTSGTYEIDGSTYGPDVTKVAFSQADGACSVKFGPGTYGPEIRIAHDTGWSATKTMSAMCSGSEQIIFAKKVTLTDACWNLPLSIDSGADVVFEGGISAPYTWDYYAYLLLYGSGCSVTIRNTPIDVQTGRGVFFNAWGRSTVILGVANNKIKSMLQLSGVVTLKTTCDYALSTNTYATPLAFVKVDGNDGMVLDLCGHDQAVGRLDTKGKYAGEPSVTGKIRSDSLATLHVRQSGGDAVTTFSPSFEGGAGLCKSGADELVLAGVSTTTGVLEVAEGALSFSGDGCWNQAKDIALSGGTLKVDGNQRLARKLTTITYSAGKLDLAQGVVVRVREFLIKDGTESSSLAAGTYTADNLPTILSGSGTMQVTGGGLMLLFK